MNCLVSGLSSRSQTTIMLSGPVSAVTIHFLSWVQLGRYTSGSAWGIELLRFFDILVGMLPTPPSRGTQLPPSIPPRLVPLHQPHLARSKPNAWELKGVVGDIMTHGPKHSKDPPLTQPWRRWGSRGLGADAGPGNPTRRSGARASQTGKRTSSR